MSFLFSSTHWSHHFIIKLCNSDYIIKNLPKYYSISFELLHLDKKSKRTFDETNNPEIFICFITKCSNNDFSTMFGSLKIIPRILEYLIHYKCQWFWDYLDVSGEIHSFENRYYQKFLIDLALILNIFTPNLDLRRKVQWFWISVRIALTPSRTFSLFYHS
jgi:hypothetical protein